MRAICTSLEDTERALRNAHNKAGALDAILARVREENEGLRVMLASSDESTQMYDDAREQPSELRRRYTTTLKMRTESPDGAPFPDPRRLELTPWIYTQKFKYGNPRAVPVWIRRFGPDSARFFCQGPTPPPPFSSLKKTQRGAMGLPVTAPDPPTLSKRPHTDPVQDQV
ncbi:hypothetical protein T492DRAFT_831321 [Pavlovales sp. CCMP2436]|nr:hypothetical protein T492DRAFT_831321 [Pavlovales sp. CCMP2436]